MATTDPPWPPPGLSEAQAEGLLEHARAEHRVRGELQEAEAVISDLRALGWTEAEWAVKGGQTWEDFATRLNERLTLLVAQGEQAAVGVAEGQDPASWLEVARSLTRPARRTRAPASHAGARHVAPCPVPGCGTRVLHTDGTESRQPHELPIQPGQVHQAYICPCEQRALLTVGRTARSGWVLRAYTPGPDERVEINLIAHALVTGQVYADRPDRGRRPDTSPDPESQAMADAFLQVVRTATRACEALVAGHPQQALDFAEQAMAARYSQRLHRRNFARERRAEVRTGRWHNGERFWIEVDTPAGRPLRLTFRFLAVYDEQGGRLTVENAQEIEQASGIEVGADGWRQLIALLTRFGDGEGQAKPGADADALSLIYRDDRGTLSLRPHIQTRYPRALHALEALRRTLRPEVDGPPTALQSVEADWLRDLLG